MRIFFLILYYGICRYLPSSDFPYIGLICKKMRYLCAKHIFKQCGKNVNIERLAFFGRGGELCIGDNSGIGINCTVPPNIIIGKNVMMGPNCFFFAHNHSIDRLDIPMIEQGFAPSKEISIGDDVWIGRGVYVLPGRTINTGCVIGCGTVLTKDFPPYSVIGGVPGKILKMRK